jgi:PAB1-binding protein PBP1
MVTVQTRSSAAYTGILTAAHLDGDVSVALTRARTTGSTECKPTPLLIMAKDILSISADAVDLASNVAAAVQGERGPDATTSFRTDVEITGAPLDPSAGRPLQKWSDEVEEDDGPNLGASGSRPWNQFETNERLFGATTNYNEEIYTTKLDRSGRDFKERERKAERLAQQILSVRGSCSRAFVSER